MAGTNELDNCRISKRRVSHHEKSPDGVVEEDNGRDDEHRKAN